MQFLQPWKADERHSPRQWTRRLFSALKLCRPAKHKLVSTTTTTTITSNPATSTSDITSTHPSQLESLEKCPERTTTTIDEEVECLTNPIPQRKDFYESTSISSTIPALTVSSTPPIPSTTSSMASAEHSLQKTLTQLSNISSSSPEAAKLLRSAKHTLLSINALLPTSNTPPLHLALARATLEAGALLAIGAQDADGFTRYWQQLQSFYELPASRYPKDAVAGQKNKITGLYLMLLLTKGDYAGFHTVLEGLEMENALNQAPSQHTAMPTGKGKTTQRRDSLGRAVLEGDVFLKYPVMLEQWLMEGAYDRVWAAVKKDGVPSDEFAVFSEVLEHTIRHEIASCSEKSYPFVPISSAKTLFFLDSEGAVLSFAKDRGWVAREGRIYFPNAQAESVRSEREILRASGQVIENTIGYARELETIV